MIDFSTISKKGFIKLARKGRLNPHGNEFNEIGMVIDGRKPAALLPKELVEHACEFRVYKGYLKWEFIPQLEHRKMFMSKCGLFRAGDHEAFQAICDAYDLYPYDLALGAILTKDTVRFDIALGRALGYTDNDVAYFLGHNYGYKKMRQGLT